MSQTKHKTTATGEIMAEALRSVFALVQNDAYDIAQREPVRLNAVVALRQAHPYVPLRMACALIDDSHRRNA